MTKKEEWNQRYSSPDFIYGIEPNEFLKNQLELLPPGDILLPGDGEGRNALWASQQGWRVTAFDYSDEAKKKAHKLFHQHNVEVNYIISNFESFETDQLYDAIGLVYIHLPSLVRSKVCEKLESWLKPKGRIILECFHPDQLARFSGGPKNPDLFPSIDELKQAFSSLTLLSLGREEIDLNEGPLHQGKAIAIRMVGEKKI